jgi:hypothetical protein
MFTRNPQTVQFQPVRFVKQSLSRLPQHFNPLRQVRQLTDRRVVTIRAREAEVDALNPRAGSLFERLRCFRHFNGQPALRASSKGVPL